MEILGIDIGRTGIKYGLVNLDKDIKINKFNTITISQTSHSETYSDALETLLKKEALYQAVGVGFPCIVRENRIHSTDINFDGIWTRVQNLLQPQDIPCFAINDADAAGIAEVYRAEANELRMGVTIVLTLGTGIGSAVFLDGKLLPNTEMGLIEMKGTSAERYSAPSVKTRESLSIQEWAARLQEYLSRVEIIFNPDHLILGGGISADFDIYCSQLKTFAHLLPAFYYNQAGVIGAAIHTAKLAMGDDTDVQWSNVLRCKGLFCILDTTVDRSVIE